jgi:hypothetical protein
MPIPRLVFKIGGCGIIKPCNPEIPVRPLKNNSCNVHNHFIFYLFEIAIQIYYDIILMDSSFHYCFRLLKDH